MKKNLFVIGFILFSALFAVSCGQNPDKRKAAKEKEIVKVQYTCPMHPEIVSDKQGDCPKCGMALVEKK